MSKWKVALESSLLIFFMIVVSKAAEDILSDSNCLRCLCMVESNSTDCNHPTCRTNVFGLKKSCGAFNLNIQYWTVCGQPGLDKGGDVELAFQQCTNSPDCAKQCVKNYVTKFENSCSSKTGCQKWTRLHFGGQNGCKYSSTLTKWNRVKACLDSNMT